MMTAFAPFTNRVFVDSAVYFALVNDRDEDHARVSRDMERLVAEHRRLFTTNYIVHETHALVTARLNARLALAVIDRIEESRLIAVVRVNSRDERPERETLRQQTDKEYSLIDATCSAVMERQRINQVLTLDRHFARFGWMIL